MRHCFSPICIMLTAILTLSSCLSNDDNDDTTYYDDTAISSFSLGTLSVVNHTTAKDGVTDSTYTTSLKGSKYKFDIDQLSATISNADSLPAGTKVSAVLATIGTVNGGTAVLNLKSSTGKDSLVYYSSSDSIDFSNPVRVRVYNMRATAWREYTVTVNVHRERPDAFAWNKTEVAGLSGVTNRHFVTLTDGTVALLGQRNGESVAFTKGTSGPALHTGYADGTAPHVLEAVTPGAAGLYLDLGQFYDRIALQKERRAIELLQTRYRALYREAYARLAAFARPSCPLPAQEERSRRFLRTVTCRGLYSAEPPAGAVQLVSGEELEALRARETAVLYQNPLFPDETEAVYLPDEKRYYRGPDTPLPDLSDVTALLAQAKALHDELEAVYNPHVDFARVYALANSHALRLFKEN